MGFSLISLKFILIAVLAIALLTITRGLSRQLIFLTLNAAFIYFLVLTPTDAIFTLAFCLLGYALIRIHLNAPGLRLIYTLPVFIGLFFYMRNYEILHWVLPETVLMSALSTIGLSFLLFKIIHVLVDVKGEAIRQIDFLTYINYCFNFTTFAMGPIQRYQDYHDQWNGDKNAIELSYEAHLDAILRILFGLIKVYILAQWCYLIALKPDTAILQLKPAEFMLQIYGFFFYLYLNFSGYCDVVIGIGSLFGVRPPENFNKPFVARNISDFWLRQHRSLTLWLTDYVFSPTYKNALSSRLFARHQVLSGNMALMLTMFVSGIWHGTTVGFLIFGIVHGLYVVVYHTWDHFLTLRLGRKRTKQLRHHWLAQLIGIFITFNATSFAFVFFQLDTPHLRALINGILKP